MQNYNNTGIEFDDYKAPWNEKSQKEEEFDCTCSQSLSKSATVFTADYQIIPEEGDVYYETVNTDWKEAWHENDHYTPFQLIELFKNCLKEKLGEGIFSNSRSYLRHLVEECEGWVEDETAYTQ